MPSDDDMFIAGVVYLVLKVGIWVPSDVVRVAEHATSGKHVGVVDVQRPLISPRLYWPAGHVECNEIYEFLVIEI